MSTAPKATTPTRISSANVLLIGCGPHAKRVYVPALKKLESKGLAKLKAVIELRETKNLTDDYLQNDKIQRVYTDRLTNEYALGSDLERKLNALVKGEDINAVIITTEPLSHMQYSLWALRQKLHVLLDKPISTHENVANNPEQAGKLATDFELLQKNRDKSKAFIINAQRRYHPGFQYVQDRVNEIAERYSIPVTSMQSTHCDGQWRLPEEIITQDYHPYNSGYGKVSHSGYHAIDVMSNIVTSSYRKSSKDFDRIGVFTSFVKPSGLLQQQTREDYIRVFGSKYNKISSHTDSQLREAYASFGEVDSNSLITLFKDSEVVGNLSLNLMHNGFARRSWILPGQDLYKGNGRVKHEHHNIEQGPYQNIQVHSYQSKDRHEINTFDDYKLGGNNHFDIHIYRNSDVVGGVPLEIITADQLMKTKSVSRLMSESVKQRIVVEFIETVLGIRKVKDTASDLLTHQLSTNLMSLIYRSGIKRKEVFEELKP